MSGALVLEDGSVVRGRGFGAATTVFGELVFNTNMTGYCEALTDPSYAGQLLMMTYPLIGNYGVDPSTFESERIQATAFIVREACDGYSHPTAAKSLDAWLRSEGVPGLADIDTRALTVKTRTHGTMRAALSTEPDLDVDALLRRVRAMPFPDKDNLVGLVSIKEAVTYPGQGGKKIVVVDTGVKRNIIELARRHGDVVRVPYDTPADAILDMKPDGVIVSNGPGDPAHPAIVATTAKAATALASELPMFGICLGHQILALAFGGTTYKLKFGHRGGNQPVKNLAEDRFYITSQNHGFAVGELSSELVVTETNLNDGTIEGLRHVDLPIFSVQYHPEASPGPHDTRGWFERFAAAMEGRRAEAA